MSHHPFYNHISLPLGATLIEVPRYVDQRGSLVALEQGLPLPFEPLRTFFISNVPPFAKRAGHAESCHEFLLMLSGSCCAEVSDGTGSVRLGLVSDGLGLHVTPGVWIALSDFTKNALLLVCASTRYAEVEYFTTAQPELIRRSLDIK